MVSPNRDSALSRAGEPVQIAVATIGADHFKDENFEPSLEVLPQLGVPNAELMCWYPRNIVPTQVKLNKERFLRAGLRPVSVHFLPFRGSGPLYLQNEVASFLRMLEVCHELGGDILKFTGGTRSIENGLGFAIDVMKYVVPVAEDLGITLVLESHFQNMFEFKEDYLRVFNEIDSPNIGVCLDMGHAGSSGIDMVELIEAMPEKIYHIDAKDCRAVGATDFVRFGTGIVPFDPVIPRALELGFTGYIIVELPRIDKATMVDDLRRGVELVNGFIGKR
jgi:sugar phosphate isomerase/epimerase